MSNKSLYYFCKYVLGFSDMAIKPHWEFCRFLEKNISNDILVLLPRGTFKSSIVSVGLTLWELTKDRDLRFFLSSFKENNPKGWITQMKSILSTSGSFKLLYGDWSANRREEVWQATAFSIPGRSRNLAQPTVTGGSFRGTEVSQHFDRFVGDDLQTDENVKNSDMVDEVEAYIQRTIPLLDPDPKTKRTGPRRLVGTRWGLADAYGRMIARDKVGRKEGRPEVYKKMIREAARVRFEGDELRVLGNLFFPSRLDEDTLKRIYHDMGSRSLFSSQYLNNPQPEGTEIFNVNDFGFYWMDETGKGERVMQGVVENMPMLLNRFTTLDPSMGEGSDSDFSAFVTVAVDSQWNQYIWDVTRGRMNPDVILDWMFQIHKSFKPFRFGIETVIFQKALLYGFQRRCRESGIWFPIESLKTESTVSKEMRIRGFQPFVKGHKIYFRVKEKIDLTLPNTELLYFLVDGQEHLVEELMNFPTGEFKDCADALAYMPQLIFPAGEPPKPPVNPRSFEALRQKMIKMQQSKRMRPRL